jgi:hypothetical protein
MGEPFFITEKETEEFLALETRELPWPDGSIRPFTEMRLFWSSFDWLVEQKQYTPKRLVELAIMSSEETGRAFADTFRDSIAYMHKEFEKTQRELDALTIEDLDDLDDDLEDPV